MKPRDGPVVEMQGTGMDADHRGRGDDGALIGASLFTGRRFR